MITNKRGQAAMEFLMTYGWAILAAIIAIGALASYGAFNPGKFTGNIILAESPFGVTGTVDNNAVTIELRNGLGEPVIIQQIEMPGCGTYIGPTPIAPSTSEIFAISCSPLLISGSAFKSDFKIDYTRSDSSLTFQSQGSITYTVP